MVDKKTNSKAYELLCMFWVFTYLGIQMFGSGAAITPILERELVEKRKWLSVDELTEFMSLSSCIPGAYTVSVVAFIGNKRHGMLGGLSASVGVVVAPIITTVLFAIFFNAISEVESLHGAFIGISVAVAALLIKFIISLWKSAIINLPTLVAFVVSLLLFMFTDIAIGFIMLGVCATYLMVSLKGKRR